MVGRVSSDENRSETPRAPQMLRYENNLAVASSRVVCARFQLKEQLASKATELDDAAAARAALESRLAEEEEERRKAHTSVMRLEAQVMNRLTNFMRRSEYAKCPKETTCAVFCFVFHSRLACVYFGVCPRHVRALNTSHDRGRASSRSYTGSRKHLPRPKKIPTPYRRG